jgi:hypothetical protein
MATVVRIHFFMRVDCLKADKFSEWKDVSMYAVRNRKSEKKVMLLLLLVLVEREVARYDFK